MLGFPNDFHLSLAIFALLVKDISAPFGVVLVKYTVIPCSSNLFLSLTAISLLNSYSKKSGLATVFLFPGVAFVTNAHYLKKHNKA